MKKHAKRVASDAVAPANRVGNLRAQTLANAVDAIKRIILQGQYAAAQNVNRA